MFTSLKNKIKEETGDDVSKLSSLASVPGKLSSKGKHSRTGSTTSIASFTIDGSKDDVTTTALDIKLADGRVLTPKEFKKLETKEDEWRKKLQKKDEEYAAQLKRVEDASKKRLNEQEKEYLKLLDKKDTNIKTLRAEKDDLLQKNLQLQEEAKQTIEYKNKIYRYQEDFDQLEGFQTQEMAKIKHLLYERDQNLVEKENSLKQIQLKNEELSVEVRRLQQMERDLHDAEDRLEELRHRSEQEKGVLTTRLAAEEETNRQSKDRLAVLEARCRASCLGLGGELSVDERVQGLLGEQALLERLLAEAHEHLAEVKTTWSGKITALETQVGRLCRQASEESNERRKAEQERDDFSRNLEEMESKMRKLEGNIAAQNEKYARVEAERDELAQEVKTMQKKLTDVMCSKNNSAISESKEVTESENKLKIAALENENCELLKALDSERLNASKLKTQVQELQLLCDSEKKFADELRRDMCREKEEKDEMMIRNAQVSQEVELTRQQLRRVQSEANDMNMRIDQLQESINEKDVILVQEKTAKEDLSRRLLDFEMQEKLKETPKSVQDEMTEKIADLENQLEDKNRMIKSLQQRVSEMKKTLQRELRVPSRSIDPGGPNSDGFIPPHGPALLTPAPAPDDNEDVNLKYLKHVLFKFLTCRECEAQHLTRAVATLLRFTAEEERLLRETMDWKTSWFGVRPKIGNGPFSRSPS